jgi:hypothetical protein
MKAHTASLINAIILVGFGLWAYLGSDSPSTTALIPVAIGVVLLALYPGVKKENKIAAHIAVLLTLLILGGLVKPLLGALDRNWLAIVRVLVMMISTVAALIFFIKSFIDVRRARKAAG